MAEFKTSGRSLYDMVKNLDANGNAIKTAEVLQKACPMLKDAPVVPANNILTHKVSIRTSLPKAEAKRLNQGVGGSFGSCENREFGMKEYQSLPWIDKMEFKYAKDPNEVRQSNMEGILQGWSQSLEGDMLYDSIAANGADSIDGIAHYCSKLEGNRVISAGGTGSNLTSIYLVAWDEAMGAFDIVPQNDTAGIVFNVLGDAVIPDPNDPKKRIAVEQYEVGASLGFAMKDTRAVARIANIDVSNVTSDTLNPELIMKALSQFPSYLRDKVVMYMPREVELALQLAANKKENASFVFGSTELYADRLNTFNSTPIRLSEMISTAEDQVA